jgi:hypothetical protein
LLHLRDEPIAVPKPRSDAFFSLLHYLNDPILHFDVR